jgi:hypothetical protein
MAIVNATGATNGAATMHMNPVEFHHDLLPQVADDAVMIKMEG